MADSIQLSTKLIFQLVDDDDKSKKKPKRNKPKARRESQHTQKESPLAGWPLQAPFYMPVASSSNPELEAVRSVLKESENVLEKIQKHEENMLKEVTLRSKELHEKEFKAPQQKSIVCQSEKDACLTCYKENTQESLKCASFVQRYQDCVQKARNLGKVSGK